MSDDHHVLLKEYIERIIAEKERQQDEWRDNLNHRLDGMNAIRQQLDRQAGTFVSRDYYDAQHTGLATQVHQLHNWRAEQEGKSSRANLIAIAAILLSALSAIVHLLK